MSNIKNNLIHRWNYFLYLEKSFIDTFSFVHLHEGNYDCFSFKFAEILILSCTEIESIAKGILGKKPDAHVKMREIGNYFVEEHPDFFGIAIAVPRLKKELHPWEKPDGEPFWWAAYNSVKHHGDYSKATLKHALYALAGLFSLVLANYINGKSLYDYQKDCLTEPQLFDYPKLKTTYICTESSGILIPGFSGTH